MNARTTTSSTKPTTSPVAYTQDGTERSCRIEIHTRPRCYEEGFVVNEATGEISVTLARRGRKPITRVLRAGKWLNECNEPMSKDMATDWHYSVVNKSSDIDVKGGPPVRGKEGKLHRHPGWLIRQYEHYLECLEIMASEDMLGKWLIRPISSSKRAALYEAGQEELRKESEAAAAPRNKQMQDSLAFIESAKTGGGALNHSRKLSGASVRSVASIPAKKTPRTSITSISTNNTSATSNRPASATKSNSIKHGRLLSKIRLHRNRDGTAA